ncbi:hypothetical protein B0H14DRAFT_2677170, partial [Mycena olivaceomarginata]
MHEKGFSFILLVLVRARHGDKDHAEEGVRVPPPVGELVRGDLVTDCTQWDLKDRTLGNDVGKSRLLRSGRGWSWRGLEEVCEQRVRVRRQRKAHVRRVYDERIFCEKPGVVAGKGINDLVTDDFPSMSGCTLEDNTAKKQGRVSRGQNPNGVCQKYSKSG